MSAFVNELERLVRQKVELCLKQQEARLNDDSVKSLVDAELERVAGRLFSMCQKSSGFDYSPSIYDVLSQEEIDEVKKELVEELKASDKRWRK